MNLLSEQKLIDLIKAGEERPDLDYKETINLGGSKEEKARITKDVIAMANSEGGVLIVGVRETSKGFQLDGMPQDAIKTFDSTRLNDFVNNYCDPPINSTTRIIEIDGKIFGVVIVPEFGEQPHIVTRNFSGVLSEGDLLVRTSNNNSKRASPHELRRLLDKSITRRQGTLGDLLQTALKISQPILIEPTQTSDIQSPFDPKAHLAKYKGFRIPTISPASGDLKINLIQLKQAVLNAFVRRHRGDVADFPPIDPIYATEKRMSTGIAWEQEFSLPNGSSYIAFAYFDTKGKIFIAESLLEDTNYGEGSLGIFSCFQTIFASLLFAKLYFTALGWEGDFNVRFSVESSIPRTLIKDVKEYWSFHQRYQSGMDVPVSVERSIKSRASLGEFELVAIEMMQEFCWYFHYDLLEEDAVHFLEFIKEKLLVIPNDLQSPKADD